jgi:hypothetical protein
MKIRQYDIDESDGDIVLSITISPGPIDAKIRIPSIMKTRILTLLDDAEQEVSQIIADIRSDLNE